MHFCTEQGTWILKPCPQIVFAAKLQTLFLFKSWVWLTLGNKSIVIKARERLWFCVKVNKQVVCEV